MTTRVLFATDGRAPATAAGDVLRRLAAPEHVAVTILHAAEYGNRLVADRYAQETLDQAQGGLAKAGFETFTVRGYDDPITCIEKLSADEPFALTVVGAGNHTWLGRLIFGSVGIHLIHHSTIPSLVVHRVPDPAHERLHVLIGVDGSAAAKAAMDTLLAVTRTDLVELFTAGVVRPPDLAVMAYPGAAYVPSQLAGEMLDERRSAAERHVSEAVDRLHERVYEASGRTDQGSPSVVLLDEAARVAADVVAVGARGLGGFARVAVGSVSAHVARHAPATLVAHAGHPSTEP